MHAQLRKSKSRRSKRVSINFRYPNGHDNIYALHSLLIRFPYVQILVKQKEDALNQLHTDFLTLNQTSGILESKKADLEEEQARLNATIKTLSDTIAESNATIEKLKTTLQAQSATLQTKVRRYPLLRSCPSLTCVVSPL